MYTKADQPLTDNLADDLQRILKIQEFAKEIPKFVKDFETTGENSTIDLLQKSLQIGILQYNTIKYTILKIEIKEKKLKE